MSRRGHNSVHSEEARPSVSSLFTLIYQIGNKIMIKLRNPMAQIVFLLMSYQHKYMVEHMALREWP